jgi:hypothetical protein
MGCCQSAPRNLCTPYVIARIRPRIGIVVALDHTTRGGPVSIYKKRPEVSCCGIDAEVVRDNPFMGTLYALAMALQPYAMHYRLLSTVFTIGQEVEPLPERISLVQVDNKGVSLQRQMLTQYHDAMAVVRRRRVVRGTAPPRFCDLLDLVGASHLSTHTPETEPGLHGAEATLLVIISPHPPRDSTNFIHALRRAAAAHLHVLFVGLRTPDDVHPPPQTPPHTPQTPPHTPQTPPHTPQTPPHTPQTPPPTPQTSPPTPQTSPHTPQTPPSTPQTPPVPCPAPERVAVHERARLGWKTGLGSLSNIASFDLADSNNIAVVVQVEARCYAIHRASSACRGSVQTLLSVRVVCSTMHTWGPRAPLLGLQ